MKKIGNKVLLMIAVFVVIFGINTAVSVRTQKKCKAGRSQNNRAIHTDSDRNFLIFRRVWNAVKNILIS